MDMGMKRLVFTVGISGSGKSKWLSTVSDVNSIIIETDSIRKELYNDVNDFENDDKTFSVARSRVIDNLKKDNINVVYFDSTMVDSGYRLPYIKSIINTLGFSVSVEMVIFKSDIHISTERVSLDIKSGLNRANTLNGIIDTQYELYKETLEIIEEEYNYNNVIYLGSKKEVACAVIKEGNRFLISKRLNGKWEFPGGKVEVGETHKQALYRELKEELGCESEIGELINIAEMSEIILKFYFVKLINTELKIDEKSHLEHRWVIISDFDNFDFMEGDIQTINHLKNNLLL